VDKELRALLQDYLIGGQNLEAIKLWLAHNIWEASIDQDSLVDHVAIELAHLTDGLTDELYFHSQVRGMIWLLPDDEVVQEIILAGTNNAVPIPEGTYDQSSQVITMVHSFA
jgi:hypothetical protein